MLSFISCLVVDCLFMFCQNDDDGKYDLIN